MRLAVLTTFNEAGYKQYGRNCLKSFKTYWPKDVELLVYAERTKVDVKAKNIKCLEQKKTLPALMRFKEAFQNCPYACGESAWYPGVKGFFWDAYKFSNKVYAVTDAIRRLRSTHDRAIWLDADTVTLKPVPLSFLAEMCPDREQLVSYLNRSVFPECGWVGYNLKHPHIMDFAKAFEEVYSSGQFRFFRESHDSYVFQRLIESWERNHGVHNKTLGNNQSSGHIFIQSALGEYLDHLKGPKRKKRGKSSAADLAEAPQEKQFPSPNTLSDKRIA